MCGQQGAVHIACYHMVCCEWVIDDCGLAAQPAMCCLCNYFACATLVTSATMRRFGFVVFGFVVCAFTDDASGVVG
jgi:hypothetical protein